MGNPHNIAAPQAANTQPSDNSAEAQRIVRHFRAELLSVVEAWTALQKLGIPIEIVNLTLLHHMRFTPKAVR